MKTKNPVASGLSIAVIGLGNIGSQLVPLLAGVAGVSRVILVDPDRYSASNLGNQRIIAKHVGRLKVTVQRQVLRALAPDIAVETHARRVGEMPLGRLRHCTILACVDSRSARQSINRIAFRIGSPWVDAALDRAGSVRARIYLPETGDCLECNWGERDYALLEQHVPCSPYSSAPAATAAPMELGAFAAALEIALLRRVLAEEPGAGRDSLARQQWFFDFPSGRGWMARYAGKNPHCRFDHTRWPLTPLARSAREITLDETFAMADPESGHAALSVDSQTIVSRVRCPQCRAVKSVGGRLSGRMATMACRRCSRPMLPAAMDASDCLSSKDASAAWLDRPLAAFGLVDGDIVTLHGRDTTTHYEVGSANARALQ